MAEFTIVVVTHDSAAELTALLDSIDRHLDPRPRVLVVDTDSSDAGAEIAADRAELLALGENPGFGAANNAGVARVRTAVTVLLNPDTLLLDGALAELAALAAGDRILAVPRLLNADRTVQRSAHPLPGAVAALLPALVHPRALPRRARINADPWRARRPRRVGWAIAACVAARTELLRELGPFDPAQFLFYEDMDLCLRAREAGAPTVLFPQIGLVHTGQHATGEPIETIARRRREVVSERLGERARALDDVTQMLTFATRAIARAALGRDSARQRSQLAAVWRERRDRA